METTCKERILDHLRGRLDQMREAQEDDEAREEFEQNILSVDTREIYRVCLSWGGPADYFDLAYSDGELDKITYVFHDWNDGAEVELIGEDRGLAESILCYIVEN